MNALPLVISAAQFRLIVHNYVVLEDPDGNLLGVVEVAGDYRA
jgi:hypothetical protein